MSFFGTARTVSWPALHGLDAGHRPPRRHEALEAEHGPRSALDAAVFLLDPPVAAWVLDLGELVDLRLKYFSPCKKRCLARQRPQIDPA